MTDRQLSHAIFATAERAITYYVHGRIEQGDAYQAANERLYASERGLHDPPIDLAELREPRCRRCGFRPDEHDYDLSCPASEDDAAFYASH